MLTPSSAGSAVQPELAPEPLPGPAANVSRADPEKEAKSWTEHERPELRSKMEQLCQDRTQVPREHWSKALDYVLGQIQVVEPETWRHPDLSMIHSVAHDHLVLFLKALKRPTDKLQLKEIEDNVRWALKFRTERRKKAGLPQIRFRPRFSEKNSLLANVWSRLIQTLYPQVNSPRQSLSRPEDPEFEAADDEDTALINFVLKTNHSREDQLRELRKGRRSRAEREIQELNAQKRKIKPRSDSNGKLRAHINLELDERMKRLESLKARAEAAAARSHQTAPEAAKRAAEARAKKKKKAKPVDVPPMPPLFQPDPPARPKPPRSTPVSSI